MERKKDVESEWEAIQIRGAASSVTNSISPSRFRLAMGFDFRPF